MLPLLTFSTVKATDLLKLPQLNAHYTWFHAEPFTALHLPLRMQLLHLHTVFISKAIWSFSLVEHEIRLKPR